ncbi:efflux RND transporter periplasmic adaptor subunit [Lacrimispora indolis]|uniref:efflux RND transporter periplasmic adaptor subunit n=1 Tax=Lacrimispora indolis TaxID=69825 RepID=UPI0003FF41DF|nr:MULTISPECIES: efflux RND transporter periplasmic adaptor subunit [Lachnospiraceae]
MQENKHINVEDQEVKTGAGKLKKIIAPLLILLVLAGCVGGYYVYDSSVSYFKTNNAKVTAKLYSVKAVTNGKLLSWEVENGDLVEQDQVLGRQEVLPYITAPISGTVVKNDGAVNQTVALGSELALVADTLNLYVGVNVEETDIMKVRLGQRVDVKLDAYPGKTFKGQVTEIDPATQTYFSGNSSFNTSGEYTKVTQLIPIKVAIENEENLPLVFGMNASVKIHLK